MRFRPLAIILVLAALAGASCSSLSVAAATVNGRKITESKVETELDRVRSDPRFAELLAQQAELFRGTERRRILNALIRQEVLAEQAEQRGISADSDEVDRLIAEEVQRIGIPLEVYLEEQNVSRDDLEELARRVVVEAELRDRVVRDVTVSEDQIRNFYRANRQAFEMIRLVRLTVKTQDDARAAIEETQEREFADVVRDRSIDDLKDEGGEIGYLAVTDLPPAVQAAVARLPVGGVSQPVPAASGFEVYHVDDRRTSSFDEVQDAIRANLGEQARAERFVGWLQERMRRSRIVVNPKYGRFDPATAEVVPGTGKLRE